MKGVEINEKYITEVDVQFMELDEISLLLEEIQSEVSKAACEKRKICTLPACKKDQKTLKRSIKLTDRLSELQTAQCWIGRIRKQKKDVSMRERNWLKSFYIYAKDNMNKRQFDKFVEQTNIKMQYTFNY